MRDFMLKKKGKANLLVRFIAMVMTVVLIFTVMPVNAKAESKYKLTLYYQFSNLTNVEALYKIIEEWYFYDANTDRIINFEIASEEEKKIVVYVPNDETVDGYVYTKYGINRWAFNGKGNTIATHSNMHLYVHWYMDGTEVLHCVLWDGLGYDYKEHIPEPEKEGYIFDGWVDKNGNPIQDNGRVPYSCYETGEICSSEGYIYATWVQHEHQWAIDEWTYDETAHWHECLAEGCPITENSQKDGYVEHEMGEWTVVTDAQFREDGLKRRECQICDYAEEEKIPKLSDSHIHNFEGREEIITESKCYEPGLKLVYCTLEECGAYEERTIEKIPHDYEDEWKYSDVIHYHKCKNCTDCIDEEYHQMTEWSVINEATFTEDGLKERHCEKCDYKETDIIQKLSDTHVHDYIGREEVIKDSTCSEEGVRKVYCYEQQCGACIEQSIPKKEHKFDVGWYHNEDIHYHKCVNCDAHVDDEEHHMAETNMVKLATKESPGIMELECVKCGYKDYKEVPYEEEIKEEVIPEIKEPVKESGDDELPPFTAPQTGDMKVVHIYATMAMIAGMTYLLVYFKPIDVSMTEETKKKLVDSLIEWAKNRNGIMKGIAILGISIVLFYYHFMTNLYKRKNSVVKARKILQ